MMMMMKAADYQMSRVAVGTAAAAAAGVATHSQDSLQASRTLPHQEHRQVNDFVVAVGISFHLGKLK